MKLLVSILAVLLLTGCTAPRFFQSTVPPPVAKPAPQIEAERAAADLLARKLAQPPELIPVAVSLSASLGAPKQSLVDVKSFDLPQAAQHANTDLQAGIVQMQKQLDTLNARLAKLQGKEVEGTGFSVLGPGMATIVIGLIVLGVIFPPAFTLMGFAYRRMKQTAGMIVEQIDATSKAPETVAAIKDIKAKLKDTMGVANKRIVHALQKPSA